MNAKRWTIAFVALALGGTAHALTSEEIANALDISPDIATFSLDGVSEWAIDTDIAHSGGSALKSGFVSDPSWDGEWRSSDLIMTMDLKEACWLSYWYKRSCYDYDEQVLECLDNTIYANGGDQDWFNPRQVLLPGRHVIKFSYQRRYGETDSGHGAWIDEMSLIPILPETAKVQVTDIKCQQRYPWNGMVDIDYTVESEDPNAEVWVYPIGYDRDSNTSMAPRSLTGDGVGSPVGNGTHRMTWTVTDDYPEFHSTAFTVKMIALTGAAPYMVIDLSGGVDALSYPVSYLSSVPEGGWDDEYKTTKLVLRLIPPGSFMMGSPSDENGRGNDEDWHAVVLTKPFYIGVFEVTQKQYELVMGANPSYFRGDMRPVEQVSYDTIRGSVNGSAWPVHNQVDANSFMGRLRSKVNMLFDLPTEAQWEYACRAGTSSALNSGKDYDWGANGSEVARWSLNSHDDGYDGKGGYEYTTKVGCYRENNWGVYDMHGNVAEWCRDYWNGGLGTTGVVDPVGASTGWWNNEGARVYRGGGCDDGIWETIRSAYRDYTCMSSSSYEIVGFRVFCSPVAE